MKIKKVLIGLIMFIIPFVYSYSTNDYINYSLIEKYYKIIESRYGEMIDNFSVEKIEKTTKKIREAIPTIANHPRLSQKKKTIYISFLLALEEVLIERLYQKTNIQGAIKVLIKK